MTLTPAELDELAALEAKATRGPWRPKREPPPVGNVWFDEHTRDGSAPIEGQGGPGALGTAVGVAVNLCDADLTAALRNHAPALLSMARRLGEAQAALDAVAHMVDAVHDQSTGPSYPGTDDEVLSGVASLKQRLQEQTARAEAAEARLAEVTAGAIKGFV